MRHILYFYLLNIFALNLYTYLQEIEGEMMKYTTLLRSSLEHIISLYNEILGRGST